jgi:hypothetical protein
MIDNVTTWADGFGRWHAEVSDTPQGFNIARREISREIMQRENIGMVAVRNYLNLNMVSIPSDKPGRVHFAEYAID